MDIINKSQFNTVKIILKKCKLVLENLLNIIHNYTLSSILKFSKE